VKDTADPNIVVDAAKKDCLDSVSCGYVSYGYTVPLLAKKIQHTDEEQQQQKETVVQANCGCSEEQLGYMAEFKDALFFSPDVAREDKKPQAQRMIRNTKTVMDKEGEKSQQPRNLRV
jgi:hypothetical protein